MTVENAKEAYSSPLLLTFVEGTKKSGMENTVDEQYQLAMG